MEELDKKDWYQFINKKTTKVLRHEYLMICELHAKYFNHKYKEPCTCSPQVIKEWIAQLNKVYERNQKD